MSQNVTLAIPHHDPTGESLEKWQRLSPTLCTYFGQIVADISPETHPNVKKLLNEICEIVEENDRAWSPERTVLAGRFRRRLMRMALCLDAPFILYCDGDRILHWLENYPDELKDVVAQIPSHDFTVLARTERAFRSHPDVQYETESIVNGIFARVSGYDWDVTAAARGLSRAAAQLIVEQSRDDTFGNDASWPLLIQQAGGFTLAEIKAEGLEYETAEKFAERSAQAGGEAAWKAQIDNDLRHWIHRLNLARIEAESMLPFSEERD